MVNHLTQRRIRGKLRDYTMMSNKTKTATSVAVIITGFILASCGSGPSLVDLQRASPAQRAQMVCVRSYSWLTAKIQHDRALKRKKYWLTTAYDGYETKRQCNTVQEPYHDEELRCASVDGKLVCYEETVTKYRSKKQCHNTYVPIDAQAAQRKVEYWISEQHLAATDMQHAWNECYEWAIQATPETLHNSFP